MAYQKCLECGTVFETKQDLVDAHNKTIDSFSGGSFDEKIEHVTIDDKLDFCGECLHDFVFPSNES